MRNGVGRILGYGFLSLFLVAPFTAFPVSNVCAKDPQGWNSAAPAKFHYWMKTLSMPVGDLKGIRMGETFFEDGEVYQFIGIDNIYALTISGTIQFNSEISLVRVILVDNDLHEYLVYEAYPLLVDINHFSVSNVCEETCVLEPVKPYSLKIELVGASIHIGEISFLDSARGLRKEIALLRKQIKKSQNTTKIKKIKDQIKRRGLKWIAGETFVSQLFYEEKKKLFGGDKVPNLQGAEYYKGGIFEIRSGDTSPTLPSNGGSSLIESFDWRNRHGANNPDSPYYDGDPTGSGWITSVTRQGCADCWAHSAVGATEALANLYFNQHLDVDFGLDLSVQDVLSCSGGGSCSGGSPGTALFYIASAGVVDEACFPYAGTDEPCGNKCVDPDEIIRINGRDYISPYDGEEEIKRNLINHGPLNFGISSWWHSMVLVGYDKDYDDGKTIWILKNSWGSSWGENGYGMIKVDLSDMYLLYALQTPVTSLGTPFEIVCFDMDGDGYYNWGISETKPSSCPDRSPHEKDCDDSNPYLGPFDSNGYCVELAPMVRAYVDIRPGSCPNPLNTKSKGVLPVAILGTVDFDVNEVDLSTIQLEGVSPLRWSVEDVATPFAGELCDCHELGADGYDDLTLKFNTQDIVGELGEVTDGDVLELTLTAELYGGTPIEMHDCVLILKKGK